MKRHKLALAMLAAAGGGIGYLLWQQREGLRLAAEGFRLYPDRRWVWAQLIWRLFREVNEGAAFARAYPHVDFDLAYGAHPRHRLDVFRPAGADPCPALLFVHGGGWESGTKALYPAVAREFVALGYVVVLINYRLYPAVTYPDFVQDAAAALRWVVGHIADYGGDPGAITLAGHSAGAHIVALLGLDARFLAEQGVDPAVVRGVVGMSGPLDLPALIAYLEERLGWHGTGAHLSAIMGGMHNLPVASATIHARPNAPPFLLLHGRDDRLVPWQQSQRLADALEAAGSDVRLLVLDGVNHFSMVLNLFGRQPEVAFSTVSEIHRFIQSV